LLFSRDADLIWDYLKNIPPKPKHKQQGKHFAVIKKNYLARQWGKNRKKKQENQKRKTRKAQQQSP